MTPAQRKVLEAASAHPLGRCPSPQTKDGYGSAPVRKMMRRLLDGGFVRIEQNWYQITDAGRSALEGSQP